MRARWTEEDEAVLRRMHAEGATAAEIGLALNRHREVVRVKARYLGLALKARPLRTAEERPAPRVRPSGPTPPVVHYSSITARVFGDPPPGRSALDQKRVQQ